MSELQILLLVGPPIMRIVRRTIQAARKTSPGGKKITPEEWEGILGGAAIEVKHTLRAHIPGPPVDLQASSTTVDDDQN